MVALQAVQRCALLGALQERRQALGQVEEDAGVPLPRGVGVAGCFEELRGELADRLEHGEARLPGFLGAADQALVDERGQALEDVDGRPVARTGHGLGHVEVPAAPEDRQASKQPALGLVQEVAAPGDRAPQRPLAVGQVAGGRGQQAQLPLQALEDLLGREELHAGGRQLDRERHAVEPGADAGHGRRVLVGDVEVRANGDGAGDEEADGLVLLERRRVRVAQAGREVLQLDAREPAGVGRRGQARHHVLLLARDAERRRGS